jgi:hypothetical protein
LSLCSGLFASGVLAQANPELGDVRHNPPPPPPPAQPVAAAPAPRHHEGPFARDVAPAGNDHASVVGHLGVGFFGVSGLPYLAGTAAGDLNNPPTLDAPTIGARYWLDERMGLEGALGIGYSSGGSTTKMGNNSTDTYDPHLFGLALHAGLPLVFSSGAHYAFELVPELNFGFLTGGRDLGNNTADISGVLLQLGARVGAEIQFGFIDIPQLALQGSVGLHMAYEGRSISVGNNELSTHHFGFGTTVQGEPWDIFTGNIAAIYYF